MEELREERGEKVWRIKIRERRFGELREERGEERRCGESR